ncbi:MAG: hypothetical protein WA478_16850 [Pseudolabrys sp.]
MLLICPLRTPLRLSGAALVLGVSLWAITSPRPDVLVADDGQTVAIRDPDGRLSVLRSSRDIFAVKEWLAAGADARTPKDASLNTGVTCDAIGGWRTDVLRRWRWTSRPLPRTAHVRPWW